jgi:hypothetical protein
LCASQFWVRMVRGVPSCQRAPSLIRQVVSIRPSGKTFHSPFSRLGTALRLGKTVEALPGHNYWLSYHCFMIARTLAIHPLTVRGGACV